MPYSARQVRNLFSHVAHFSSYLAYIRSYLRSQCFDVQADLIVGLLSILPYSLFHLLGIGFYSLFHSIQTEPSDTNNSSYGCYDGDKQAEDFCVHSTRSRLFLMLL